jgi:hypothetical protein
MCRPSGALIGGSGEANAPQEYLQFASFFEPLILLHTLVTGYREVRPALRSFCIARVMLAFEVASQKSRTSLAGQRTFNWAQPGKSNR